MLRPHYHSRDDDEDGLPWLGLGGHMQGPSLLAGPLEGKATIQRHRAVAVAPIQLKDINLILCVFCYYDNMAGNEGE